MKPDFLQLCGYILAGLLLSILITLFVSKKRAQRESDEEYEKYFKRLDDPENRRGL
jgi:hypothetical protein